MIPSAILFDLDGTILDSDEIIIQSWKTAHKQTCPSIEWNEDKLLSLMGQPEEAIPYGMNVPRDLHTKYLRIFSQKLEKLELPLFDDVIPVLEEIKEKNIPLCVVTGAKTEEALELLIQNNIEHFFTEIIGADLTKRGKPYPDPINLAIERLNLNSNKKNILFIGDSINDLLSAYAAEVVPILLWRKKDKIPNNLQQNAELVITRLPSLLDLIE
ncbi:MAG: HAD family hydrolase [Candidatus Heimdallarchaeota archaeon]|nr:MAG: HAD family hydrolase [Candidatus Heimdallarchaeota archaeon]